MGRADFLSFVVVLAEISSGVKEFFRSDGGHDARGVPAEQDGFARGADSCRLFLQGILERTARGIDSAISIFEQPPHIDGNARVGKRIERTYLLDIPQINSIRGVDPRYSHRVRQSRCALHGFSNGTKPISRKILAAVTQTRGLRLPCAGSRDSAMNDVMSHASSVVATANCR